MFSPSPQMSVRKYAPTHFAKKAFNHIFFFECDKSYNVQVKQTRKHKPLLYSVISMQQ